MPVPPIRRARKATDSAIPDRTTLLPSREEASACADLTSPPGFQALRPAERGRQQPTGQAETVMATILAEPAGRRPRPARRLPVARVAYIHCDRDGWRGWGRGPGYSIYFAGGDAGSATATSTAQTHGSGGATHRQRQQLAAPLPATASVRAEARRPLPARRLPAARAPRRRQR